MSKPSKTARKSQPVKRPPGRPSQGKTARMQVVLTPAQHAKARQRGGSPWVASLIEAAE